MMQRDTKILLDAINSCAATIASAGETLRSIQLEIARDSDEPISTPKAIRSLKTAGKARKPMSAAARHRMQLAQKKRWAAYRKTQKAQGA